MGKKTDINDATDEFDRRLDIFDKLRIPNDEVDAAVTVYERLKTAGAICESLLVGYSTADVVALALEIGRVKQSGQALGREPKGGR